MHKFAATIDTNIENILIFTRTFAFYSITTVDLQTVIFVNQIETTNKKFVNLYMRNISTDI